MKKKNVFVLGLGVLLMSVCVTPVSHATALHRSRKLTDYLTEKRAQLTDGNQFAKWDETKFIVEDIIKRKDIDAIDKILEREDFELIKYLAREIVLSDNIPSNIILEQYIDENTGEFIDKNLNKSEDFYKKDGTAKDDTSFKKKRI